MGNARPARACLIALALSFATLPAMGACQQRSTFVETGHIYATMIVSSDELGETHFYARLMVHSFKDLILTDDDALYAEADGVRSPMHMQVPGTYGTTLNDLTPLTTVTINLERGYDESAPDSRAIIPPAFELEPLAQASYGRRDPVTVRWSPTVFLGTMSVLAEGDCIIKEHVSVPDTGSFEIRDLMSDDYPSVPCEVRVSVTRGYTGTADPAYDRFSWIRADQVRVVTFTSTP